MSGDNHGDEELQIPMMVMTDMLKPPKTITNLRVVPRTMEWDKLIAVALGVSIGAFIGYQLFGSLLPAVYTGGFGAVISFLILHITPFADESLWSWISTSFLQKNHSIREDGTKRHLYIGIAPVTWSHEGRVMMRGMSISAPSRYYDKRGYPLTEPTISADPSIISYDSPEVQEETEAEIMIGTEVVPRGRTVRGRKR